MAGIEKLNAIVHAALKTAPGFELAAIGYLLKRSKSA
jgi:hypothetical protein